jgi:hypothetical protein
MPTTGPVPTTTFSFFSAFFGSGAGAGAGAGEGAGAGAGAEVLRCRAACAAAKPSVMVELVGSIARPEA